ncbi:MAG: aminoacyl-tRNA hydrolase [Betaproteobacteria bacterium]|jgi:PTH1 family peptidyl-tRNA hydrolase|nr:aminoacyl-tRNA hydrolase [Betaproteobacteria bacterium]
MKLIVGLGNPGSQYAGHRHNVGFWVLDRLVSSGWSRESKFKAEIAKARIAGADRWLCKPQTYMNASGEAVGPFARFHRLEARDILVIHDELDLPPGAVRLKQGGGHGGHNGVRDIELHLGSADFWRLRIGIGHPRTLNLNQDVADFVLHDPRAEEKNSIDQALSSIIEVLPEILEGKIAAAQRRLHGPTKHP